MKKFLFFILFFYILALLQTSFFVHFSIYGGSANLILISVILVNFFERTKKISGLFIAGIGGFYLDVFSGFYIGTSVFLLVILSFFIKKVLDFLYQKKVIYFVLIFFLMFAFYNLGALLLNSFMELSFPFSYCLKELNLAEIIYNLVIGLFCFYLIKLCSSKNLTK